MSRENGAELHFSWAHSNYYSEITLEKVTARHYTRVLKQSVLKVAIMRKIGKNNITVKTFCSSAKALVDKGYGQFCNLLIIYSSNCGKISLWSTLFRF